MDTVISAAAADVAPAEASPGSEAARVAALHALAVLDTPAETVFDHIVQAAAQACGVPIALVSLVDSERQWFKASTGLPGVSQTPRALAFCDHAIRGDALFEIGDAARDARFSDNALVTGTPNIRFYAGAPIVMAGGERVGTVCVIDRQPRALDDMQRGLLQGLARIAAACLTERARLQATAARLAAGESRYRAIVEDQTELISLAHPDGTLHFVNAAYARHFGLMPGQMLGRNLLDFVDAADRAAVAAHLAAVCDGSGVGSGVNRMIGADGALRWVAWTNRLLPAAGGNPPTLHSVGRDITQQQLAQDALAAGQRRERHLYEASPAALHSIDVQGRLLHVSDRWLEVFGYRRDEVLGRPSTDFLAPESARHAREVVLPAFFRDGRCDEVEYRFLHKQGHAVDVLLSARLERDEDGKPAHSLAIVEDISERKRLSAELGRTHAHLEAIVDNVPAMMGFWDQDGVTRFANREFQAATGLPLERIVGRPLAEIYSTVDPTGYAQLLPHLRGVLGGQRQEFECALLGTTGLRQLRVTLVPAQPEPGRITGFYGLWYDITGRKALELRLGDSEQRYRSLFDHLNSGFALHEIVVDALGKPVDYRYLAMNAAFSAMTGLEPAHAIGQPVTELLPGIAADPADWIGRYGQVALTGEPIHFEQYAQPLGRWFEVVAYRPARGQFAVIAQDITQRKQTEAAVALGEQRLRLLVDAVHDHSMVLLDAAGRVAAWNLGAQRIMGYAAEQIVGRHYRQFFERGGLPQRSAEAELAEATEQGRVAGEGWRHRGDGSRFWAATTLTAVRDPRGALQGFVELTRDLTERQRQRDMIERMSEMSPSAMLLIDGNGRLSFANAQTLAIFGYRRDELIGNDHAMLLPDPARSGMASDFMVQAGHQRRPRGRDLTARRKDGSTFEVQAELCAFDTPDGPATLVAVTDISDLRRQQQRLQDALAEKETLLKEVYHRVKNNLQVVQSLLSLRRQSLDDGAGRRAIDETVQRVRAMALVHEKLYQSGNLAALSLADYTQDLLKQVGEATGASQRRVLLHADIAPLRTGLDNAIPFGLLVTELVTNALKHAFAGRNEGRVTVSLLAQPGGALLTVQDDGAGLAPGFELGASSSMGLQLAASLARQLGGELRAHTAERNGSTLSALLTRL